MPDANVSRDANSKVLVSDDFSHVYFESTKQLVAGAGVAGDRNLYVLSGGKVEFVADPNDQFGVLVRGNAQLSTDGKVLVFAGAGGETGHYQLTADRLDDGNCIHPLTGKSGEECRELFLYSEADSSLECLSCSHGGITTYSLNSESPFQASADGHTVAFSAAEKLTPADINGSSDLYEWRDGALRLLTDGETTFPSGVGSSLAPVAVDRDGSDIFFKVADPGLTGFEQDGLANLYDARVGGGFERPSPPIHCSGESCQGPLQAPPASSPPASSSFTGHDNAREGGAPRCAKGKVRRSGRCVKRHGKKHQRNKRSRADANKGGSK